jgi:hypothetical protein
VSTTDKRALPEIDPETGLYGVSPTQAWRKCSCRHLAYRDPDSEPPTWTCGCPIRGGCHGPKQVAGPDGTPQLVWSPYTFHDAR